MNYFDMKGLSDLLKDANPDRDSESDSDNDRPPPNSKLDPGSISQPKKTNESKEKAKADTGIKGKDPIKKVAGAIWSPEEIPNDETGEILYPDVSSDPRQTPNFDFYFQQQVTPEDVFLQMGNKTTSTASCETMCVDIFLPGEDDFNKIQLDVKFQSVEVRSPMYILILPLPHKINPRAGTAKWHGDKKKLALCLALSRELDDFNF